MILLGLGVSPRLAGPPLEALPADLRPERARRMPGHAKARS